MIDKANVGGSVHELNDTGARGMISTDVFSTAASYAAGDYCIYNNALYKFTAAKSAGAWDTSKVAVTAIASELSALNSSIDISDQIVVKQEGVSGKLNVESAKSRNGVCQIVIRLSAGANGNYALSVPFGYIPGFLPGTYSAFGDIGDAGKCTKACMQKDANSSIIINLSSALTSTAFLTFIYLL